VTRQRVEPPTKSRHFGAYWRGKLIEYVAVVNVESNAPSVPRWVLSVAVRRSGMTWRFISAPDRLSRIRFQLVRL
jgi:hypothetical protein